jgi:hypothetical protein
MIALRQSFLAITGILESSGNPPSRHRGRDTRSISSWPEVRFGEVTRFFGVQLIAPHHCVRSRKATQDGRVLRRYRRRWKIERLFAWLHNFRRVVVRWEYYPENFLGMVQLACAVILLRYL